jgi:hypothetical protein
MVAEFSVAKETREHGERTRCQGLIDKRLLFIESFNCRAAG